MINLQTLKSLAPPEVYELLLYTVFLFAGIHTLIPHDLPANAVQYDSVFATPTATFIYGVIIVLIGLAGIIGIFSSKWAIRYKVRSNALMGAFLFFLFIVLLSIQLIGFFELSWTTYFLNAAACAIAYLHIRVEHMK